MVTALRSVLGLLAALVVLAGAGVAATWAPDRSVASLQARWAVAPSAFIDVGGLRVHYRDEGPADDATPIVLLHGTSASLHTWEGWVAALRAQRRVVTLDLPGFGLTGPDAEGDYRDATYVRFSSRPWTRCACSASCSVATRWAAASPGRPRWPRPSAWRR